MTGYIVLLPINKKGEKQKPDSSVKNESPCSSVRKESSVKSSKGLDSWSHLVFIIHKLLMERKEEFLLRKVASCDTKY